MVNKLVNAERRNSNFLNQKGPKKKDLDRKIKEQTVSSLYAQQKYTIYDRQIHCASLQTIQCKSINF